MSLCLAVIASGCATTKISVKKEAYLKDVCGRNNVLWQWDPVLQMVTLTYKGEKAKVLVGSDLVLIGKDRITLSAPVRTVRSTIIVPLDFQTKVINRLHQKTAQKKRIYNS